MLKQNINHPEINLMENVYNNYIEKNKNKRDYEGIHNLHRLDDSIFFKCLVSLN